MNPLPRLLGLALLVVLAALAALLAGPFLHLGGPVPAPIHAPAAAPPRLTAGRVVELSHRAAFPLALTGLVLVAALLVSLAVRPTAGRDTRPPFAAERTEIGALAKLAKASVDQGAALVHERHGRERAEADALLNQQLLNRSLEEKIRLGRDLHDGIIQSLYAAGLTIEAARSIAKTDPAEADRRLGLCRQNLNQAIRDVRTYIAGLAPENLRQSSFTQALQALVGELGASRDVRFDLTVDDTATARLSPEQSTEALQIAREAISNAVRHGGAARVTVRLHPGEREVCLLVQDDGCGFDPAHPAGQGHGLGNMHARAHRLGATLRLESARAGGGTRVLLTLPVDG